MRVTEWVTESALALTLVMWPWRARIPMKIYQVKKNWGRKIKSKDYGTVAECRCFEGILNQMSIFDVSTWVCHHEEFFSKTLTGVFVRVFFMDRNGTTKSRSTFSWLEAGFKNTFVFLLKRPKNNRKCAIFQNWLDTCLKIETHEPNVYSNVWQGFWSAFLD